MFQQERLTRLCAWTSSVLDLINDIVNNIESVIKLFADDTSLSLALNNPDSRAEILNHDLEQINEWAKKWKVRFNEEKN